MQLIFLTWCDVFMSFFPLSTQSWEVLKSHMLSMIVKLLSDTRWESKIDALKPLPYELGKVMML